MEQTVEFQRGVVRTNCVDCLDRTNCFKQLIGEIALGIQIAKLNNEKISGIVEVDPSIIRVYRLMYQINGDHLSLQYGGSIAHKQNESHNFEFVTSIKRHISNNLNDQEKQQAIDLFLRAFIPKIEGPHIWETTNNISFFPDNEKLTPEMFERKE